MVVSAGGFGIGSALRLLYRTGMLEKFEVFGMAKKYCWLCRTVKINSSIRAEFISYSSAIPVKIAQGSAQPTLYDQKKYYEIALRKLRRCQIILDIENIENESLINLGEKLTAILKRLSR